jgi:hypothetical protein
MSALAIHRDDQPLSRSGALLAALLCAGLGIAASIITAKTFILGLSQLEPNSAAREALAATGVLIIASELAAFGLAAWMPRRQLRAQRWKLRIFGLALLAFEFATLTATNVSLVQSADAAGDVVGTRITELSATIEAQRSTAASLRANADSRTRNTRHTWAKSEAAADIRKAAAIEADLLPLARELGDLKARVRPTLSTTLGQQGMVVYSVCRGLLLTVLGIVFFGVSGALVRESRKGSSPPATPVSKPESPAPMKARFAIGAATPFAAIPAAGFAMPAPVPMMPVSAVSAAVSADTTGTVSVPVSAKPAKPDAVRAETVKVRRTSKRAPADGETRYMAVMEAVSARQIPPSIRGIRGYLGCGQEVAERIKRRMEGEGVI